MNGLIDVLVVMDSDMSLCSAMRLSSRSRSSFVIMCSLGLVFDGSDILEAVLVEIDPAFCDKTLRFVLDRGRSRMKAAGLAEYSSRTV